ncbi:MAG TPA: hypothetical protein VKP64_12570, partial [Mycobacteriales bacterium]|nr:hypothetical protein [Mycobacteriales bacterium]
AVDAVLVPEPQTIVAAFRDELDQLVRQTTKAAEAPTRPRAERRGERTWAGDPRRRGTAPPTAEHRPVNEQYDRLDRLGDRCPTFAGDRRSNPFRA